MKIYNTLTILIILYIILLLPLNFVYACAKDSDCVPNGFCDTEKGVCLSGNDITKKTGGTVSLDNPLGDGATNANINILIGKVINAILGVVGSLALAMFIYGGLTWMLENKSCFLTHQIS